MGWTMICFAFLGTAKILLGIFRSDDKYFATVLLFLFWLIFLYLERRVVRIELRRETVNFVLQFGRLISRTMSIKWHRKMKFRGVFRSINTEGGTVERYFLSIKRPRSFLPWKRSFSLDYNERQGYWIVSALISWAEKKAELYSEKEMTLRD